MLRYRDFVNHNGVLYTEYRGLPVVIRPQLRKATLEIGDRVVKPRNAIEYRNTMACIAIANEVIGQAGLSFTGNRGEPIFREPLARGEKPSILPL